MINKETTLTQSELLILCDTYGRSIDHLNSLRRSIAKLGLSESILEDIENLTHELGWIAQWQKKMAEKMNIEI